jgi:hypothetical protein
MKGNFQVRFLGGGEMVTSPCYPACDMKAVKLPVTPREQELKKDVTCYSANSILLQRAFLATGRCETWRTT